MKWFKHDSAAHIDARIKKVKHKYGIVGYGLYWYCIELIALDIGAKNITFALEEDAETIAMEWSLDQLKVQEMMLYMVELGLFEKDALGRVTCLKLAKRLDDTNSKNPEIQKVLSELKKSKEVQIAPTPTNSENVVSDKIRLDETNLDNNKDISATALPIVDQLEVSFDQFWIAGMRKVNKKKALSAYKSQFKANKKSLDKVNPELHFANHLIMDIKKRLDLGQLGFAEMHPTTYLNGERWNDDYPEKRTNTDFIDHADTNWAEGLENEFHGVNK